VNAVELLPAVRELYSRLPESYHLEPWELHGTLFMMGYTEDLQDEGELAAAIAVARGTTHNGRGQAELMRRDVPIPYGHMSEANALAGVLTVGGGRGIIMRTNVHT
jgi:hypothetical protein